MILYFWLVSIKKGDKIIDGSNTIFRVFGKFGWFDIGIPFRSCFEFGEVVPSFFNGGRSEYDKIEFNHYVYIYKDFVVGQCEK